MVYLSLIKLLSLNNFIPINNAENYLIDKNKKLSITLI